MLTPTIYRSLCNGSAPKPPLVIQIAAEQQREARHPNWHRRAQSQSAGNWCSVRWSRCLSKFERKCVRYVRERPREYQRRRHTLDDRTIVPIVCVFTICFGSAFTPQSHRITLQFLFCIGTKFSHRFAMKKTKHTFNRANKSRGKLIHLLHSGTNVHHHHEKYFMFLITYLSVQKCASENIFVN